MKSQKGITLTALTVYVIVFLLVIGIISTLTSFFYKNVMSFDETTKSYSEINKFNMYFLKDIKKDNTRISNFTEEEGKNIGITLYSEENYETNVYKFEKDKKAIYRNGTLICKNIDGFEIQEQESGNIIKILIITQGTAGTAKTMTYAINN